MLRWVLAFALLLLAAPVSARVALFDDVGADGGQLIFSYADGSYPGPTASFAVRRVGEADGDVFSADNGGLFTSRNFQHYKHFDQKTADMVSQADLPNAVLGANDMTVYVLPLPPGDYEIYSITLTAMIAPMRFGQSFSGQVLRFHIGSGRATYVGAFSAVWVEHGGPFADRWVVVSNDQADRDLPIAQAHTKNLDPIDQAVFPPMIEQGNPHR